MAEISWRLKPLVFVGKNREVDGTGVNGPACLLMLLCLIRWNSYKFRRERLMNDSPGGIRTVFGGGCHHPSLGGECDIAGPCTSSGSVNPCCVTAGPLTESWTIHHDRLDGRRSWGV